MEPRGVSLAASVRPTESGLAVMRIEFKTEYDRQDIHPPFGPLLQRETRKCEAKTLLTNLGPFGPTKNNAAWGTSPPLPRAHNLPQFAVIGV